MISSNKRNKHITNYSGEKMTSQAESKCFGPALIIILAKNSTDANNKQSNINFISSEVTGSEQIFKLHWKVYSKLSHLKFKRYLHLVTFLFFCLHSLVILF